MTHVDLVSKIKASPSVCPVWKWIILISSHFKIYVRLSVPLHASWPMLGWLLIIFYGMFYLHFHVQWWCVYFWNFYSCIWSPMEMGIEDPSVTVLSEGVFNDSYKFSPNDRWIHIIYSKRSKSSRNEAATLATTKTIRTIRNKEFPSILWPLWQRLNAAK